MFNGFGPGWAYADWPRIESRCLDRRGWKVLPVGKRWETSVVHRRSSPKQSSVQQSTGATKVESSRVEVWIGSGVGGEPQEEQLSGKRVPERDRDRAANGRGE